MDKERFRGLVIVGLRYFKGIVGKGWLRRWVMVGRGDG